MKRELWVEEEDVRREAWRRGAVEVKCVGRECRSIEWQAGRQAGRQAPFPQ